MPHWALMYLSHFALSEAPFSIAPDPRYLFMSQRHQEALAHLLYGLGGEGGFVLLSGEVGAGKTTVCRCLLEQIPANCDLAYVFNPKLSAEELLATLCSEFRIALPAGPHSIKVLVDALNAFLLAGHAEGRHAVVIIDEAQNLSADVLEQMRLLTNLETNTRKLLQIILVGQPELDEMLAQPSLRQLAQRVVARYHLDALSRDEVASYVRHRLAVAGCHRKLFPDRLIGALYRLSGGVPRLLNLLCDRALLGTYTEGRETVSRRTLQRAAREVLPVRRSQPQPVGRRLAPVTLALSAVVALALTAAWWPRVEENPSKVTAATQAETPAPSKPQPKAAAPVPSAAVPAAGTSATAMPASPALAWPASLPREQSADYAYAGLYQAWGLSYTAGTPCGGGTSLRCRTARGGLDELRQIDRPVVLYLSDGEEFLATLLALDTQGATLDIGGERLRVSPAVLASHWSGRYTLLWRAPEAAVEKVRPGDHGAAVNWLARQLQFADGQALAAGQAAEFDEVLRGRLKQYQLQQGLAPDGQVGVQTLVRLAGLGDNTAPRLAREGR
ncbi:ExeA family protein [Chitinimonas sp.]|uniref:ExeA family protein n=1 Tax=Chitinimonas sp. TaxID=1934313 RepID=UPI002F94E521